MAGDILAALKTTNAQCQIQNSEKIKKCSKIVSLRERALQMLIAKKSFDEIIPIFERQVQVSLKLTI